MTKSEYRYRMSSPPSKADFAKARELWKDSADVNRCAAQLARERAALRRAAKRKKP